VVRGPGVSFQTIAAVSAARLSGLWKSLSKSSCSSCTQCSGLILLKTYLLICELVGVGCWTCRVCVCVCDTYVWLAWSDIDVHR
jgi:hypothetical protein